MPSYLRRRGHTWFFRWKWPHRLAAVGFPSELIRSLKTADVRIARRRALTLFLRVEALTNSSKMPGRVEAEGLVRQWIDACVWRQEIHRAETGGFDFLDNNEIETMGREDAAQLDGLLRFARDQHAGGQRRAIEAVLHGGGTANRYAPVVAAAGRALDVPVDHATPEGRLFARTILRGYATLLDELRETVAAIPKQIAPAEKSAPKLASFRFTEFWDEFEARKLADREWKSDTAANARGSLSVFDRIFPGITISEIVAKPIAADFKSTLLQLPRHYARGERASLSINDLIAAGNNLQVADRVQNGTVNKHSGNLSEYWSYLVTQKKLATDLQNPFAGQHITRKKGKAARAERNNWTPSLEQEFFRSPLYTGCASIHRRAKPGECIHRDALFWMPLLARTMGTRENETCDALVGAVRIEDTTEGPVPYLQIIGGKDSGSERDVPFPDLVLDMGFMEQRVIGRDPAQPLFPELIPQGPGLRRSAAFSDRFGYYRRAIGVYRPRVDFHSFRGNVETDLKNSGAIFSTAWIDELIGHESAYRRSEGERYTKKIYLPLLRRLVNSIRINADLSHLRYSGERGVAALRRGAELALFVALAEKEMRKKSGKGC
jgi:hypothetical protein